MRQNCIQIMISEIEHQISSVFKDQPVCIHNCNVYKKDFETMLPFTELGSQSIHLAMEIIGSNYKNLKFKTLDPFVTNMLIHMGDQPAILESMQSHDLFLNQLIFIPSNTETKNIGKGSHWFLNAYHTKERVLYIFDSAYEAIHQNAKIIAERLHRMEKMFLKVEKQPIKIVRYPNIVKQDNYYDCGIYVIGFYQQILREFSQQKKTFKSQDCVFNIEKVKFDANKFHQLRSVYFGRVLEELIEFTKNK